MASSTRPPSERASRSSSAPAGPASTCRPSPCRGSRVPARPRLWSDALMVGAGAGLRLGIDIGGTFTDFALVDRDGRRLAIHKQLTTPKDPALAVLSGIRSILADNGFRSEDLAEIVHGTTLVTNALIERRGARTGML